LRQPAKLAKRGTASFVDRQTARAIGLGFNFEVESQFFVRLGLNAPAPNEFACIGDQSVKHVSLRWLTLLP
jgi:hypothetical protein